MTTVMQGRANTGTSKILREGLHSPGAMRGLMSEGWIANLGRHSIGDMHAPVGRHTTR